MRIAAALCCALLTVSPAPASEFREAQLALKADALALEKRAQAALEAIDAGQAAPVNALASDLAAFADRTRRLAERTPGSYLRNHLNNTASELAGLAEQLADAEDDERTRKLLDKTVSALFWAFRG